MVLLDPRNLDTTIDMPTRRLLEKTVGWFEGRGKAALKHDDHERVFYRDFLDFQGDAGLFSTFLTPPDLTDNPDARWDTSRVNHLNEILGFYGLAYWYTWQVSILGLGPIWMSGNDAARRRAAQFLADGEVFGFGLSEKDHGADIYSSDMLLRPDGDGFLADGSKYYIGNGNVARMVSTFGRLADSTPSPRDMSGYVFFAADSQHPNYELVKNVVNSQNFVSEYRLDGYPVGAEDVLHTGEDAWNAALNTVNVGKYNLGWASIGICTHAFYEAITHANNRILYGGAVTEFPHVQQLFHDAYARLIAMKLFASRASDYFRSATRDDRRYLLFNPIVKMKVTTEGERVIDHLWDVIAAKGFEKDTYFEMAARDIRALPKLEGTVHVNLALILKFAAKYLFDPGSFEDVPKRHDATHDTFLFDQGPTRGLSRVAFHDFATAFASVDTPNIRRFGEQIELLKQLMLEGMPSEEQQRDLDFMMTLGEMFTLVPYAHLILEEASLRAGEVDDDLVDAIFDVFVRDLCGYAVQLHGKRSASEVQQKLALELLRPPVSAAARFGRVVDSVRTFDGAYAMPL